jgi:hypothetical protein
VKTYIPRTRVFLLANIVGGPGRPWCGLVGVGRECIGGPTIIGLHYHVGGRAWWPRLRAVDVVRGATVRNIAPRWLCAVA